MHSHPPTVECPPQPDLIWREGEGFLRSEQAVADEASAFASDNNKDFAHDLDLVLVHWAPPAALFCAGTFIANVETFLSWLPLASFMSLHTDAREIPCSEGRPAASGRAFLF
jgi:hypothetical protein